MKDFQWKNNFINQNKKTEHINKYELLLLMLKVINPKTSNLEENIESLKVQDFSVYEDFYIKCIVPKSETINEQSKLLHNQQLFNSLLSKIYPDKYLKCNRTEKNEVFNKFSKYVNLKDIKNKDKNYKIFSYGIQVLFVLSIIVYVIHALWPLLLLNVFFVIKSLLNFLAYSFNTNLFFLNRIKINNELCLIELQKELEELEKILKVSQDPYKNKSFEDCYEIFSNMFSVPATFLDTCEKENIIDENNMVYAKYNHSLIQYLKSKRNEKFKNENFDWQLINHIIIFDISKNRKSDFLKEDFKKDSHNGEYYTREGKMFQRLLTFFE